MPGASATRRLTADHSAVYQRNAVGEQQRYRKEWLQRGRYIV